MLFPFVQFEFTHAIGPGPGRYVVAPDAADPVPTAAVPGASSPPRPAQALLQPADEQGSDRIMAEITGVTREVAGADVLVIGVVGARARRPRLLRQRARSVRDGHPPREVALALATVVRATRALPDERSAEQFLERCRTSEHEQDELIEEALVTLNRAVRAYRVAATDPYVPELTRMDAREIRIGYGSGDDVFRGEWRAALTPAPPLARSTRSEQLRPVEMVAAVLRGGTRILEAEELALRAALDLDQGRPRAAAQQLRATIELLVAELASESLDEEASRRVAALALRGEQAEDLARRAREDSLDEEDMQMLTTLLEEGRAAVRAWRSPMEQQGSESLPS
jgi:hypothetical protein